MLRLASSREEVRTEAFAVGEVAGYAAASDRAASFASTADLRGAVVRAVVPRLVERLRRGGAGDGVPRRRRVGGKGGINPVRAAGLMSKPDADPVVGEMVEALLRHDIAGLCRMVEAACAHGLSLPDIYLAMLAPAAATIDRLIAAEACSPAAGTLAFCNLQIVLRRFAGQFYDQGGAERCAPRALLVPAKTVGDLPLFGLLLTADFLRRAGWEVRLEPSLRLPSVRDAMRDEWFDLVQIASVTGVAEVSPSPGAAEQPETDRGGGGQAAGVELQEIAAAIRQLRREGGNHEAIVVACGPIFANQPDLVRQIGANYGDGDPATMLRRLHHVFHSPVSGRTHGRPRLS